MPVAPAPLVAGASWFMRCVAVALTGVYLLWGIEPDASLSGSNWFFVIWGPAVWAWFGSRLALARVGADGAGVWVRGFLGVRRIGWDDLRAVEPRNEGVLEFATGDGPTLRAGAFVPPVLCRVPGVPATAQRTADVLTLMARYPELRPNRAAARRELGPPMVLWALGALVLVAVDWTLVR
ncbi:PH domain-containing protein [Streptomyces broussonetiae]|uniref:PH domain-containing protein n=1 Tax=Streptomyces broussonetiae TaxID=2686304 RepID=A0ABV5EFL4_9ACTN